MPWPQRIKSRLESKPCFVVKRARDACGSRKVRENSAHIKLAGYGFQRLTWKKCRGIRAAKEYFKSA